MNRLTCPHCSEERISIPSVPKDVVVVIPCPACHEFVVLFREKMVALDRTLLEEGSHEERKMHLASVIAEFLDPDLIQLDLGAMEFSARKDETTESDGATETASDPISQDEVDLFTKTELAGLDRSDYFHKHFD